MKVFSKLRFWAAGRSLKGNVRLEDVSLSEDLWLSDLSRLGSSMSL